MDAARSFLDGLTDPKRQADAVQLAELMQRSTGAPPAMWGTSIVGFGTHHYRYPSGREGDTPAVGFAPRKAALVLYGLLESDEEAEAVLALGPCTTGKGCVYIKDLASIDQPGLQALIEAAFQQRHNVD